MKNPSLQSKLDLIIEYNNNQGGELLVTSLPYQGTAI